MDMKHVGALAFGMIIGWYVYYVNRYRKGDVQFSDITTLIGAIGGGALLKLFDPADPKAVALSPELFGWYGFGLAAGFFGYFLVLVALVSKSNNFFSDWFLDGRRKNPANDFGYGTDAAGTVRPMGGGITRRDVQLAGGTTHTFYLGTAPLRQIVAQGAAIVLTTTTADKIKDTCERLLPADAGDCSGFAKAVCAEFGVTLTGNANDIVDQLLTSNGWTELGSDAGAGKKAADAAAQGLLVIGARKELGHGHVVVVVQGAPHLEKYPHAYWGKLNDPDNAGYDKTVNWAWNSASRDSVTYASHAV
jgi:hypothetical protein